MNYNHQHKNFDLPNRKMKSKFILFLKEFIHLSNKVLISNSISRWTTRSNGSNNKIFRLNKLVNLYTFKMPNWCNYKDIIQGLQRVLHTRQMVSKFLSRSFVQNAGKGVLLKSTTNMELELMLWFTSCSYYPRKFKITRLAFYFVGFHVTYQIARMSYMYARIVWRKLELVLIPYVEVKMMK